MVKNDQSGKIEQYGPFFMRPTQTKPTVVYMTRETELPRILRASSFTASAGRKF